MSESHKSLNKTGANHPMFGKSHTEETKARMSQAKILSAETRDKMSISRAAIIMYSKAQELIHNFSRKAAFWMFCKYYLKICKKWRIV
jgi:hypothetical protein